MIDTKICSKCGYEKFLCEYYYHPHTKDNLRPLCIECIKKYSKQQYIKNKIKIKQRLKIYNKSERGKAIAKRYRNRRKDKLTLKKYNAHSKLHYAIKTGKIKRPNKCSNCSKKCKPEGHHDDYNKPLEVIWLCRQCHI